MAAEEEEEDGGGGAEDAGSGGMDAPFVVVADGAGNVPDGDVARDAVDEVEVDDEVDDEDDVRCFAGVSCRGRAAAAAAARCCDRVGVVQSEEEMSTESETLGERRTGSPRRRG